MSERFNHRPDSAAAHVDRFLRDSFLVTSTTANRVAGRLRKLMEESGQRGNTEWPDEMTETFDRVYSDGWLEGYQAAIKDLELHTLYKKARMNLLDRSTELHEE